MWCLSGRFDPVTGVRLAAKLDAAVTALFAQETPSTCPSDPVDKQRHLAALALGRLIEGGVGAGRSGRPEYVVVVDASQPDGAGGPVVDWAIPVDVPQRVLADMMDHGNGRDGGRPERCRAARPRPTRSGAHDPLGRPGPAAGAAGAVLHVRDPGMPGSLRPLQAHHIVWWRHGGRTDLHNLLPVCTHHHSKIHDAGWVIELGTSRELTVRFPDGAVHNTGPPSCRAASSPR